MFIKILIGFKVAKLGDYTFIIKERINGIYDLKQVYKGSEVILKGGTFDDCVEAASECAKMMYGVSE